MVTKRKINRRTILPKGKITQKVIPQNRTESVRMVDSVEAIEVKSTVVPRRGMDDSPKMERTKRYCLFCQNKSIPSYTDLATLRRFLTDRAKIVNKERSGVCSKHQRAVSKNIKYARHLALLPFVPKI